MSALSLGLLAAPLALSAKSFGKAYVESYHGRTDIPVPVSVVAPEIADGFAGTVVELVFVVDETGTPAGISAPQGIDPDLARDVIAAVAQWKFSPARNEEGQPVARKVILPVHIVDRVNDSLLVATK